MSELFDLSTDHSCLDGGCPHVHSEQCVGSLRNYVRDLCYAGRKQRGELERLKEELKMAQNRFEAVSHASVDRGVALSEISNVVDQWRDQESSNE